LGGVTEPADSATDLACGAVDAHGGATAPAPGLTIGQAAGRTGLSVHTLRYYEREGLLPAAVGRGPDGRRVYTEDDLEWLEICSSFRASGMPLATIDRYASLVRRGPGNETERLALLRQHEQRVTTQISDLTRALDLITYKVKVYQERLAEGTADRLWSPAPSPGDRSG
jgi:DNA-binding transcriptional MerR regulator